MARTEKEGRGAGTGDDDDGDGNRRRAFTELVAPFAGALLAIRPTAEQAGRVVHPAIEGAIILGCSSSSRRGNALESESLSSEFESEKVLTRNSHHFVSLHFQRELALAKEASTSKRSCPHHSALSLLRAAQRLRSLQRLHSSSSSSSEEQDL